VLTYQSGAVSSVCRHRRGAASANDFRLYDELNGDFDHGEGHATAMAFAITNPADTPTTITLTLVKMDGSPTV
jgi:hypothetical protein